jgi:hypothetical protein
MVTKLHRRCENAFWGTTAGTVAITTPVNSNEQLDRQVGHNDPLLPYNWPAINGATAARVLSIA